MRDPRTQTDRRKGIDFSRIEKFHPYKTFLFFALLGSTIIFMTITFLYLVNFSRNLPDGSVKLPKAFFLSALLMLFSSFTMSRVRQAFIDDSFRRFFAYLGATLLLGMLFAGSQFAGWNELFTAGFPLDARNHYSFFYVLSGIHFLHVIGGLLFLVVLFFHGYRQSTDPIRTLLYFSNQYQLTRIELATIFWHFVDFLWLGLFLVFLFTF